MESADDLVGFELTYLLGMAFQLLLGEFVRRLDELGYEEVKPVHGMAFQVLKNGGATGTELASRLGITKQAVSVMVAQLEEMGYVERVDHPSGGRRQLIRLTEKATVHLDVAGRVLHDLEAELTGRIGSMPVRILRMELAEMVWALSQGEIPPLRPVW
ncbi:MAG TPA: MarR family transcriptional regulator [Trebonia sp.]